MPLLLDATDATPGGTVAAASCVTVGLINNMPDAALEATERQFVELVRASARNAVVRLPRKSEEGTGRCLDQPPDRKKGLGKRRIAVVGRDDVALRRPMF